MLPTIHSSIFNVVRSTLVGPRDFAKPSDVYIGNQVMDESPIEMVNIAAMIDLGVEVDIDSIITRSKI